VPSADVTEVLGQVLRQRRLKAKLSQEEVAFRASTQQGYISLIERGERSPSVVTLSLLARALDTSMTSIIRDVERALTRS